ncbi:uncharacterized protein LOC117179426 [Belonocnema kinseyi]|uniref:uncharacterized protein LOC117179426 n=1 Tax=Belonocnema kinseyi TaxID=2817044 RepID=UPI00143D6AC2|nr:uncharacterized protein LOC117179426 [Belonocnema kinseyi]
MLLGPRGTPHRERIVLTGIGASRAGTVRATTQVSLQSYSDTSFYLEVQAPILPRLTSQLPSRKPTDFDSALFADIKLADSHWLEPDSIDIILGVDVYGQVLRSGLRRFPPTQLIAQDTVFGWIISGSLFSDAPRWAARTSSTPLKTMHCALDDGLQEMLQRFWAVEEVASPIKKLNPEDEVCDQLYSDKHSRNGEGRYTVRLPLKAKHPPSFIETRRVALSSLSNIHPRFLRDPQLAKAYQNFMKEYEELGHTHSVEISRGLRRITTNL